MTCPSKVVLSLSALTLLLLKYKKMNNSSRKQQLIAMICVIGGVYLIYIFYQKYSSLKRKAKFMNNGLDPKQYQKYKLIKKVNESHNTRRYRFALQTSDTVLGLPTGKHISFRYFEKDEKKSVVDEIRRPYTPVTSDRQTGYFETVIKVYSKGKMSQHLETLVVNRDYIEARGPVGNIHYMSPGWFEIRHKKVYLLQINRIGMVAGGTGITPMLQIINEIISVPHDKTQVSLIFGNVSIDDILLYDELRDIRNKYKNIKIRFIIDKVPRDGRKWNEDVGYITKEILHKRLFPPDDDVIILNCGPPIMVKICRRFLLNLGYEENKIIAYN